jgi:hypothetical protein
VQLSAPPAAADSPAGLNSNSNEATDAAAAPAPVTLREIYGGHQYTWTLPAASHYPNSPLPALTCLELHGCSLRVPFLASLTNLHSLTLDSRSVRVGSAYRYACNHDSFLALPFRDHILDLQAAATQPPCEHVLAYSHGPGDLLACLLCAWVLSPCRHAAISS